jgi:hypothetical protein
VLFALQSWLSESPTQKANSTTPGYFSVMMSGKCILSSTTSDSFANQSLSDVLGGGEYSTGIKSQSFFVQLTQFSTPRSLIFLSSFPHLPTEV